MDLHRLDLGSLACLTLLLGACSGNASDNNTSAVDAAVVVDAGTDDAGAADAEVSLEPSTLFGACVEDAQCPGVGAVCRSAESTGTPGGVCTVPCEDRTPCDFNNVYHHCLARIGETQKYCERRCINGLDCGRSAFTCQLFGDQEEGVCYGLCVSDEECGAGLKCEPYSGRCVTPDTPNSAAINGEPCAALEDCRSNFCISEADNGWPGGSCISRCILPSGFNSTSFYGGETLPQAGCPEGNVCLSLLGSSARGDPGGCLKACDSAADCRPGYMCRKEFEGSGGVSTYTNGVCWPG